MRDCRDEVYIYTKMGKFIVNGNRFSYCDPKIPQVCYDQYGNCIDHVKRVITNVAGKTMDFEPETTDGMLLNNGLVAINYKVTNKKESYKIFDCNNFNLISKHDGYFCPNEYKFYNQYDGIIPPPVETGITNFVRKTIYIKERYIFIHMYTCSEELITCCENNESFEFTIIPYNLTFSTEKIKEMFIDLNVYLYENFIITDWDILDEDNTLNNYRIEFVIMSSGSNFRSYEIESKGRKTKAAARAEMD
jgi:hypothetical protein